MDQLVSNQTQETSYRFAGDTKSLSRKPSRHKGLGWWWPSCQCVLFQTKNHIWKNAFLKLELVSRRFGHPLPWLGRLLTSSNFRKAFCHMWFLVWNRTHWQEGHHHPSPLWQEGCQERLLASPAKLYEVSWVWVLTSWSRCLDERIRPKVWIH